MIISPSTGNSTGTLDGDLAHLQQDIAALHTAARLLLSSADESERACFAQHERSVSFRLDCLARVLAAQDTVSV